MLWKLNTGAPWRDIPERYGPWAPICDRFVRWRRDGTLDRMLERLHLRLDEEGPPEGWSWPRKPIRVEDNFFGHTGPGEGQEVP